MSDYIDDEGVRVAAAPEKKSRFFRKHRSIYGDQLLCLLALAGMAVWRSGPRAAVICAVSVLVAMLTDYLCCRLSKKTYNIKDLSTVAGGFCLALMLPASVGYGMVAFGAALAIGIKHIFGGKDNYVFNPAGLSFAFLIVSYPAQVLAYPASGEILPVFGEIDASRLTSGLESYLVRLGTTQKLSPLDVLIGNFVGPIGTIHVLVIAVCGLALILRRALSPAVTLTAFGAFLAGSFLFPSYDNITLAVSVELISGFLLFGLVFLANDPQTIPKSILGRIYYGLLIGVLTIIFRHITKVEASFVFVLLLANALSIHVDRFADKTIVLYTNLIRLLKKAAGGFERVKASAVLDGDSRSLNDTQEIIVPLLNYNMPAIDSKIIKAKKRAKKKVKPERKKSEKDNIFLALRAAFGKKRGKNNEGINPENIITNKKPLPPIKQPKKKSETKNNKSGQ